MIIRITATAIGLSLISTSAFAGSVVTNSTTTRNVYGHGKTEFSSVRNSTGTQENFSQSVKAESYAPHATASVTLKDGKLSGTATGSTSPINPDPIAIIVNSSQKETVTYSQQDISKGYEQFSFNGNEYTHQVQTDNF